MKNAVFFLTPKQDLNILSKGSTIRQSIERLEKHHFNEMVVVDQEGKYEGIISAKDLLLSFKMIEGLDLETSSQFKIKQLNFSTKLTAVHIDTKVDELVKLAKTQNVTPVIDANGIFIGIVRRADLLEYYYKEWEKLRNGK